MVLGAGVYEFHESHAIIVVTVSLIKKGMKKCELLYL